MADSTGVDRFLAYGLGRWRTAMPNLCRVECLCLPIIYLLWVREEGIYHVSLNPKP